MGKLSNRFLSECSKDKVTSNGNDSRGSLAGTKEPATGTAIKYHWTLNDWMCTTLASGDDVARGTSRAIK